MSAIVSYQLQDQVASIVMDDGKANALSLPMLAALNGALDRALSDKAVVLLTGRNGVFSAGFDLPTLAGGGDKARAMLMQGFELAERLLSFPTPVLIACNGHALAMGVFLLLSGDYRIGADGPYKIGANEVAIGLTMPYLGIEISRQRLAPAHFSRALINAEIYSPADAVAAGFLDRIVPAADLASTAGATATALSKLNMSAHAVTKLRTREQTLKAVRAAIEADRATLDHIIKT